MPGLVGYVGLRDHETTAQRFGAALERMRRHPRVSAESRSGAHGQWRLGHVALAGTTAPEREPGPAPSAVVHGVLYNEAALRAEIPSAAADSTGALVAELYRQHDVGFITRLEGQFCLALID